MPNTPSRGQGEADGSTRAKTRRPSRTFRLVSTATDYPHWDVEPEDPLPDETLDDGTADERASRDGDPGDRAPTPSALPRIGGGVASMINASASGTAMPPPMPCRARAAMRRAMVRAQSRTTPMRP